MGYSSFTKTYGVDGFCVLLSLAAGSVVMFGFGDGWVEGAWVEDGWIEDGWIEDGVWVGGDSWIEEV